MNKSYRWAVCFDIVAVFAIQNAWTANEKKEKRTKKKKKKKKERTFIAPHLELLEYIVR